MASGTRCSPGRARSARTTPRLARRLATLGPAEVARRQRAADHSFQARGITFAVNQGLEGVEKIMPFDLVPRMITPDEWRQIERGLEQRVRALNLFLHDIYHEQRILAQGVVPSELVLGARGYRREFRGVDVPLGRLHPRRRQRPRARRARRVLRAGGQPPHAVRRLVPGREPPRAQAHLAADLRDYDVRPVEEYPQDLLDVLRAIAPPVVDEPNVVVLTPGRLQLGLLRARLPGEGDGRRAGAGLRPVRGRRRRSTCAPRAAAPRVDVIYRRVDDDFLDPLTFRPDSLLGVPGLVATYRLGRVSLANAIGTGVADDKAIYAYVPRIIRYYLGEDPIIPNVPTYLPTEPDDLKYILEHLDELVVKSVNESGGYGMLIGPHASARRARGVPPAHHRRPARLHRPADAGAVAASLLGGRPLRGAPRRPAPVRAVRHTTSRSRPAA